MIDMVIIICIFASYIIFEMTPLIDEVKTVVNIILVSAMMFYIAYNVNDLSVHYVFVALGIVSILLIPIIAILKYLEKLQ